MGRISIRTLHLSGHVPIPRTPFSSINVHSYSFHSALNTPLDVPHPPSQRLLPNFKSVTGSESSTPALHILVVVFVRVPLLRLVHVKGAQGVGEGFGAEGLGPARCVFSGPALLALSVEFSLSRFLFFFLLLFLLLESFRLFLLQVFVFALAGFKQVSKSVSGWHHWTGSSIGILIYFCEETAGSYAKFDLRISGGRPCFGY